MPGSARTLLLGTESAFPAAVLHGLVAAGSVPCGVVVEGSRHANPILATGNHGARDSLPSLAAALGLPLRAAGALDAPELAAWIDGLAPDFILVACCSRRLPAPLCALARRDCLNLHPSLLPRYRGPAPLFWQLRAGERDTGVTLHRVTAELDGGPIVAQAPVPLDDGLDHAALDARLGAAGAALYAATLARDAGRAPAARAQQRAAASYFGLPRDEDFRVSTAWSARRVFNFIRGTGGWGHAYPIALDGGEQRLRTALGYTAEGALPAPAVRVGNALRVRCSPGVLHATLDG